MLVSSDKKIIILFPPKTASTAVNMAMNKSDIKFDSVINLNYPKNHLKLSELCELHDLKNIEDYTILQFTRNPYYRFVSAYFHLMRFPNKISVSFFNMKFQEFANHLNRSKLSNDFIKTFFGDDSGYYQNLKLKRNWSGLRMFEEQVSWNDLNAKIHYYKIENVTNDMSPISDLLNCKPISMELINKNPKEVNYDSLLDVECMEIIYRNFINDFKVLGYDK